jgi:hypothetical protein
MSTTTSRRAGRSPDITVLIALERAEQHRGLSPSGEGTRCDSTWRVRQSRRRDALDGDGQVEVVHDMAHDGELLKSFFEVRGAPTDDREELRHHGRDAAEVVRAGQTAERSVTR